MSRLRVRVELNRGGVGVPLHKLSSVVQEAERFFQMLAQDVRIETGSGEWLAFDFDNESLNFTAEFVGPVSPEQVESFADAFDGSTPLRRATIAQFTRITDAIGQDELIGFGLYHSDQELEPSEWRCLSRRDALRIADEIQLLLGASGELDQETRLPTVIDHDTAARLFKERHDRGPDLKMPALVREMEANLSKRIARLEGEVDDHSHAIHELKELSGATESSFRNLLTSVEKFCAQATRQLERMAPPAQLAAPQSNSLTQAVFTPPATSGRGWRAYTVAAILIIGIVSAVVFIWAPKSGETGDSKVAAASAPPDLKTSRELVPATPPRIAKTAPPSDTVEHVSKLPASDSPVMHVEIEAHEPSWVAVTDSTGKRLLAKTLETNETQSFDLTAGATLRTGNAGGVVVRFNGQEIGPLGPTGKIRDISFKNGVYKIHAPDAG